MARASDWCFTVNNPTFVVSDLPVHPNEAYVVWQLERVTTPHIQGFIQLDIRQRLPGMKKWLPTAHFEVRKGDVEEADKYCRKEDSRIEGPWERGVMKAAAPGKRNDLDAVKEAIRAGKSKLELYEDFSEVCSKYPRFVSEYGKLTREAAVPKLPELVPKFPWQASVLDLLKEEPHDRQILWVHDGIGNHGKTYLAKYLVQEYKAFYTNGGKSVDLAYAYQGEPVVIFDYVRDSKEFVGYGVIEQLKNGILMSTKYESGVKRFPVPHVMVFANFRPEEGKFSGDRLQIVELNSIGQVI